MFSPPPDRLYESENVFSRMVFHLLRNMKNDDDDSDFCKKCFQCLKEILKINVELEFEIRFFFVSYSTFSFYFQNIIRDSLFNISKNHSLLVSGTSVGTGSLFIFLSEYATGGHELKNGCGIVFISIQCS